MTHTEHAPMSRAEHERTPVGMAEVAANLADLARRDLDTIYTAREATTLAHVHAACEVSRALAAAAEAIAYVADPEADPGRTHERDVEGCTTDCEPGPEEPEQFRDSYLCRWCGGDLSEWPDPAALEATCVYRPAGAGVTTASAERPTRVVFGPFDDQAYPPRPPEPRPDGLVRPFDTAFDPAPSPSPFDDCGEVCPESLAPRGEGGIACRRITGHPGEHQGSTRVSIVRWTTDGVSVRYGAGAS